MLPHDPAIATAAQALPSFFAIIASMSTQRDA
jgi:hypothetical protein